METSDILIFLTGLVLVVNGVIQIVNRYVFLVNRCTAQVSGNILNTEVDNEKSSESISKSTSYSVKYNYMADGVEYIKKRSINKRMYRSLYQKSGSVISINVFYDPSKPKRHYVTEIKFRMLLTLGLIILGAFLLYYPYYYGL